MENKQLEKELKTFLAGDGNAYDRMNAGQGGTGLPDWFLKTVKILEEEGVSVENFDEKTKTGKLSELIKKIDGLTAA